MSGRWELDHDGDPHFDHGRTYTFIVREDSPPAAHWPCIPADAHEALVELIKRNQALEVEHEEGEEIVGEAVELRAQRDRLLGALVATGVPLGLAEKIMRDQP